MIEMMENIFRAMIESDFTSLCAQFTRQMFEDLLAQGFSEDQAIQLLTGLELCSPGQ